MSRDVLLITGATGLVGSHVAERAVRDGYVVRALVRDGSPDKPFLKSLGVELAVGDLTDAASLRRAVQGAKYVVHCAAMVGDWGKVEDYRALNYRALRTLLDLALAERGLDRFVMMSSLGVYAARDHFGTDEGTPPNLTGIDAYTRSKAESEQLVLDYMKTKGLRGVVLRPGFIYGPRDRQVLPRLAAILKSGGFWYFGDGNQKLNNTGVRNLAHAVMLALTRPEAVGEVFNITDDPLVSRVEFVGTVAKALGIPPPQRKIPRALALPLAFGVDRFARLIGTKEAPRLSMARYKFLALHLEYSIAKAKKLLGYHPPVSFQEGMTEAVRWYQAC